MMMPRLSLVALLAALCACVSTGVRPADLERAVALKALEDQVAVDRRRDTVLLLERFVAATAESHEFTALLGRLLPERFRAGVPPDLFHRYWEAKRTSASLEAPGRIRNRPVRRVKAVREAAIPAAGGIYSVSRVGFSASQDSALVTVSFACRGLCGSDDLYLYVKGRSGWERRRNLLS